MPRSVGITVSALATIIGSAFTALCGAMFVLGSFFLPELNPATKFPAILRFIVVMEALVLFGFAGWGIAAGIGLIKLKRWARISMLVFAAILVFLSLPPAVLMAFIPLPNANDPNLPSSFMSLLRIGMVLFYVALAALGVFWLYFFSKRSVKAQFQGEQPYRDSATPQPSLGISSAPLSAIQRVRPLSITIIGWFLLIGSAFAPLFLLLNRALFPGEQFPIFLFGFFFFGQSASLIFIVSGVLQVMAAVGLLKLRRWGLFSTIGLQCLTVLNAALLLGIPADRARFHQIVETMMASLNARMPTPVPFVVPDWIGYASALPIVFVILWFLITRKQAFH